MKTGKTSRSMKLIGLAAKLGKSELTQSLKDKFVQGVEEVASGRLKTRIEQAKMIAENLSQMKGAAMKAGQLLSLDASDFLPPEAVDFLSKLQGQADPLPWTDIRSVLEKELGSEKMNQFSSFSTTASASASIGQVHKAVLHGKPVAVKIQYPGVAESIDSDLTMLKTLAKSGITLSGRKMNLDEAFEELSIVLHQEADYLNELKNMREYRELLAGDDQFIVPEPIESHSTKRVLTMSWEEGLPLTDWIKTKPKLSDREHIGRLIMDLYYREFYEWGFVQTDPNYANFLIRDRSDGLPKLVILDFGATLRYPEEFRTGYKKMVKTVVQGNRDDSFQELVDFNLIDPRESKETIDKLIEVVKIGLEPFDAKRQPFRFADANYSKRNRDAIAEQLQNNTIDAGIAA
ncbi:MAG: AarF/ABC1/UbiB kinase family protein, partial [Bdellovibrionota bacterium]